MSEVFELEVLSSMPNYHSWIMEAFAPLVHGRVVEYGAEKYNFGTTCPPGGEVNTRRALGQFGSGSPGQVS
jgi:hypothetical protein